MGCHRINLDGKGGGDTLLTERPRRADGMLHMMFKLGMCAQGNCRRLRGFNYLAQVISGVKFKDGIEVKAVDQVAAWLRCRNTAFDNGSQLKGAACLLWLGVILD